MQWDHINVNKKNIFFFTLLIFVFNGALLANDTKKDSLNILKALDSPVYINQIGKSSIDSFKKSYQKEVDRNMKRPYLFYFTSTSVPIKSMQDFLISTYKIKQIVPELRVVQYFRGLADFKNYLPTVIDLHIQNSSNMHMAKMLKIKLHPRRFKELNIKKVPAIVYAECYNDYYENCELKYIVRGDIGVASALKLFSVKDKKFNIWEKAIYDFNKK